MGPGVSVQGQLTKGATYQVTLSARMVAGQPASTLLATVQRTPVGGSAQFDPVVTAAERDRRGVGDGHRPLLVLHRQLGLIFYVQTASGNASYYIDAVSIAQVAPPPGPPGNTTGASATFESNTTEGWGSRTGGETVAVTDGRRAQRQPQPADQQPHRDLPGPGLQRHQCDVQRIALRRVSCGRSWRPGQAATQLRVSLQRNLGTTTTTFHTVVGNTTVTADAWVRLQATYDLALANSSLTLYVESASGTPSFYIDDFSITFVPPAVAERDIPSVYQTLAAFFPVGAAVSPADIRASRPSCWPSTSTASRRATT